MTMRTVLTLGTATALAVLVTAPIATAQEAPGQAPDQGGQMMGDDMPGMEGMMPMMQMGPMMQACTEMMATMTEQMDAPKAPETPADNG